MVTRMAQGDFWLSSAPDTTRRGQILFNEDGSVMLVTEGGFDDRYDEMEDWWPFFVLTESQEPVNLHGLLASDHVKMVGCVVESASGGEVGKFGAVPPAIKWRCGIAFIGDSYEGDIPQRIESATLRISGLNDWVSGFDAIRVQIDGQNGQVTWVNTPVSRDAEWSLGKIALNHRALPAIDSARHHLNEVRVASETFIGIELNDPQPWDLTTDVVESLQCLLSISSGQASNVENVSVEEFDGDRRGVTAHYKPILYCSTTPVKFPPLLSFEDIGGVEGVAKWIDVLRGRHVVRRALMTDMFLQPTFITDRTGHLITACEALMRHTGAGESGRLSLSSSILRPLVNRAGSAFQTDIGDVEQWISKVSQIRNHYGIGHLQSNPNAPELEDVLVVNRQLSLLVTICLLKECGVPETTITKVVQRSQNTWWVAL